MALVRRRDRIAEFALQVAADASESCALVAVAYEFLAVEQRGDRRFEVERFAFYRCGQGGDHARKCGASGGRTPPAGRRRRRAGAIPWSES